LAPTNAASNTSNAADGLQVHAVRSLCDIADRTKTVLAEARETEQKIARIGGGDERHPDTQVNETVPP
jgi:hypothetical protein